MDVNDVLIKWSKKLIRKVICVLQRETVRIISAASQEELDG